MDAQRIAIVGGSITGCTAAIAALRSGLHPQVFEKSSGALADRGAGLAIPSGVAVALQEQGFIYQAFPHVSIRALAHSSRSDRAPRLGGRAGEVPTFLEGVRWGHLFDHLRSLVPNENYHSGIAVTGAQNVGNGATVTFDNGQSDHYDAVVFADGYRSLGRDIVCSGHKPEYQGYFIWRGTLAEREIADVDPFETTLQRIGFRSGHWFGYLLPNASGSVAAGTRELNWGMFLPVVESELATYLVDSDGEQRELSLPPGCMRADLERALKDQAHSLLPQYYAELVDRTENTFGQGIVAATPDHYRQGRICLAGDAGAMVPPFTTSGVFKGMKNAVELVAALAADDRADSALAAWEAEQRRTGAGLKRLSEMMANKLINDVPDFAAMGQSDLTHWWSDIQVTLEAVLG